MAVMLVPFMLQMATSLLFPRRQSRIKRGVSVGRRWVNYYYYAPGKAQEGRESGNSIPEPLTRTMQQKLIVACREFIK